MVNFDVGSLRNVGGFQACHVISSSLALLCIFKKLVPRLYWSRK